MAPVVENTFHPTMSNQRISTSLPPIVSDQVRLDDMDPGKPVVKRNGFMVEEDPRHSASRSRNKYLQEFFNKEPCLYSHTVYKFAAGVFSALKRCDDEENPYLAKMKQQQGDGQIRRRDPEIPHMEFDNEDEQRLTFTLAFSALKYQKLLEAILEDVAFFATYPEYREDSSLVTVMFCDFQQRKFQRRIPQDGEVVDPQILEIEGLLYSSRTKMNASLARTRVKAQASSLEYLLPEKLRIKEQAHKCDTVVYAWVNQFKTSLSAVIDILVSEGFKQVQPYMVDPFEGAIFYVDAHCCDLIALPAEYRHFLMKHELVEDGNIVIQDKSSSLAPVSIKSLMDDGDDVIHVNLGSGQTTAHLASLVCNTDSSVFAFGIQSDKHYEQVKAKMDKLGIRGVRIVQDAFTDISPEDPRFKNVKAILVTADCSKSGVPDPVEFIVNEGEGANILQDLASGEMDPGKLSILCGRHQQTLRHAFRFSRVQGVVYCTRSMYEQENETVVSRAIDQYNTSASSKHQRYPFKLTPPVLPVTDRDLDRNIVVGKFLKFPPAAGMSGCFVALIIRELEDPKEATKDILARAAAKGLLGNRPEKKATRLEKMRSDHHHHHNHSTEDSTRLKRKKSPKKAKSRAAAAAVSSKPHNKVTVSTRLYSVVSTSDEPPLIPRHSVVSAPHVKIVHHPAPFR